MNNRFEERLKEKEIENIVSFVKEEYEKRRSKRKNLERQWELNINFLLGNQYCGITGSGEIENFARRYVWQQREVYNHIAPIIEKRLNKLHKIKPTLSVVPATDSEEDMQIALFSKKLIKATVKDIKLEEKMSVATLWSEVCGTSFYKVMWNNNLGQEIGKTKDGERIYQGDVELDVCSPFEIYVDNNNADGLSQVSSIIQTRVYKVDKIKELWGVDVTPKKTNIFGISNDSNVGGYGYNASIKKIIADEIDDANEVIEYYEKPTNEFPNGRHIIVAGENLLYMGELPYMNGKNRSRDLPFIVQTSNRLAGNFWGTSVVERLIPIQRTYNAVKNRKYEIMNRISAGVIMVEDGSVDVDALEEEGLAPGKIIVYRQGSKEPKFLSNINIPEEFHEEEKKLLDEFDLIGGISENMEVASKRYSNMSGNALSILLEEETNNFLVNTENIKTALKILGSHILRLYKQFASTSRLYKTVGKNESVEMYYFDASKINSDDINFETETYLTDSLSSNREIIKELLNSKLLENSDGSIDLHKKNKLLEMLGFGIFENEYDICDLHIKKAKRENFDILNGKDVDVLDVDDDDLHIKTHTAFLIDEANKEILEDKKVLEKFLWHIKLHNERKEVKCKHKEK